MAEAGGRGGRRLSIGAATRVALLSSLVVSMAVFGGMSGWVNGELGNEGFATSAHPSGFFSPDGITIFLAPPALGVIALALLGAAWSCPSIACSTRAAVVAAWLFSLLVALRLGDALHCTWGTVSFGDRPARLGLSVFLAQRNWACGQLDALPVASRTLARSCCSVFPATIAESSAMLAISPPLTQVSHPEGNPGANLKSISHRCYLF